MTNSSQHAAEFYSEVAAGKKLWTIKDSGGFPAPKNSEGKRSSPFWSSIARVRKIIETAPAYSGFTPHEISWDEFVTKWVPGMTKDGLLVGINWAGGNVTGYDVEPNEVKKNVETVMTF